MKLLELIVKNIKRENIDPMANYLVQDWSLRSTKIDCFTRKTNNDSGIEWRGIGFLNMSSINMMEKSDDSKTTIITREELMRAYDLVEQGYTLWFGGDCPVGDGVIVEVAMKDESLTEVKESESCRWDHYGSNGDIIAYRVNSEKNHDVITEINDKDFSIDIINLISSVAPKISVSDAIEIANSLIDEGYHK